MSALKDQITLVVYGEGDATFARLDQLDGFSGGTSSIGDITARNQNTAR